MNRLLILASLGAALAGGFVGLVLLAPDTGDVPAPRAPKVERPVAKPLPVRTAGPAPALTDEELALPGVAEGAAFEAAKAARKPGLAEVLRGDDGASDDDVFVPVVVPVYYKDRELPPPTGPFEPTGSGVEALFLTHSTKTAACMRYNAPPRAVGEKSVMIQVTITPDGEGSAKVTDISAPRDEEGLYRAVCECLVEAFADATFYPPFEDRPRVITWALRRA